MSCLTASASAAVRFSLASAGHVSHTQQIMARFLTVPKFVASLSRHSVAGGEMVFQSAIDREIRSWIGRTITAAARRNQWNVETRMFGTPVGDHVVSYDEIESTGTIVSVEVLDETFRLRNTWTLTLDNGDRVGITWSLSSRDMGMSLTREGRQYNDRMRVRM